MWHKVDERVSRREIKLRATPRRQGLSSLIIINYNLIDYIVDCLVLRIWFRAVQTLCFLNRSLWTFFADNEFVCGAFDAEGKVWTVFECSKAIIALLLAYRTDSRLFDDEGGFCYWKKESELKFINWLVIDLPVVEFVKEGGMTCSVTCLSFFPFTQILELFTAM